MPHRQQPVEKGSSDLHTDHEKNKIDTQDILQWVSWRHILLLILFILACRIAYLTISPYELVADESHYWEWSCRPALSYYTKGPGVAWTIAASTHLLGDSEWAIRVPSAVCGAITMLVLASLSTTCAGDIRAGFFAVLIYLLTPICFGVNQFMTIDGPYIACWALSIWSAWHVFRSLSLGRSAVGAWFILAVFLGVGFLYKYTILLLVPGLVLYAIIHRRRYRWGYPLQAQLCHLAVFFAVLLVCISPVLIWNHLHGWPTLKHLLGHLHMAGGDITPRRSWSYQPMWTIEMILGQLGALGPPVIALVLLSLRRLWQARKDSADQWMAVQFMLCCGLPVLLFYFLLSFITDVEANWPLAGYLSFFVVVAIAAPGELQRYRVLVITWLACENRPRPRAGYFRRRPETAWQIAWHWTIGWGLVACLFIMTAPLLRYVPGLENTRGLTRVTGHREWAGKVQQVILHLSSQTGTQPLVIADQYGNASLLAYYLPDRPSRVFSAASLLGGRVSAYDYFPDTDLNSQELTGRTAVLVGSNMVKWRSALAFDRITLFDSSNQLFTATGYGGVKQSD